MVTVRKLNKEDANIYQTLRLRALKTDSNSFGSTYEREVNFTKEQVEGRIHPDENRFVLGAFDEEGSLVGVVRFMREMGLKSKHKGTIYGMYVAPESRGQSIGKALLNDVIRLTKEFEGLEQLLLQVVSTNVNAKQLYKSLGFETYGVEPKALKVGEQYLDEDLMVLFL